jgi:23S rRNA (pseudouridine1915-N3)-methyltransferase
MLIHLLCVGRRMPAWVEAGYQEYAKRLPPECALRLVEIEPGHRGKGASREVARREEGSRLLAALPKGARVIALDERGSTWNTTQLAAELAMWLGSGQDLALLVGGAEGLDQACRDHADRLWSLSPLTFPHPLVRVILAEQLYRAWSLLSGHPYHRA